MNDHAIIVGITSYPGLTDLEGPCKDAEKFYDWLVDDDGGGLDEDRVQKCLSTDFDQAAGVDDAHPQCEELWRLFKPHVEHTLQHGHTDGRLFIYVAGHGFSDTQASNQVALFAANAEPLQPLHLAVTAYAQWFHRNWAFDEIIVIMDCCRVANPMHQVSLPMLPRTNGHKNAGKVRTFYAHATKWQHPARERPFNGTVRGIFTVTLMDALHHASPDANGNVTGSIVRNYIHNSIEQFAGDVTVEPPDIDVDPHRDVHFVSRLKSPGLPVTVAIPNDWPDCELLVRDGQREEVLRETLFESETVITLPPGLYKAEVEIHGQSCLFEVPTDEPVRF